MAAFYKKEWFFLILILFALGVLKFVFFTNLIIPPFDSYEHLLSAKSLRNSHTPLIDSGTNFSFLTHAPGYPFLIALFYPLFHDFERSAAFVTVSASILSIFLVYLLMESIKKGAGKFAAFLLATSSLHLQFSNEVLRGIPGLCLICFILYFFYDKQLSAVRIISLGILIGLAFYIHMETAFLLFPFLFFIFKQKRLKGSFLFLGIFFISIAPYWYLRLFKWPAGIYAPISHYKYLNLNLLLQYTLFFFKSLFLRFIGFDPLILVFGIAGIYLILKGNIARQLLNPFWKTYFLSCVSIIYFISVGTGIIKYHVGESYMLPLLVPFVLIGSISLESLFEARQLPRKKMFIMCSGSLALAVYMAVSHRAAIENAIKKMPWIFALPAGLIIIWLILLLKKKTMIANPLIIGALIAFGIQALDEGIHIKGQYKMKNRGKELSSDINALKDKILPKDAYLMGLYDAMAILYHTGYPLLHEDYAKLLVSQDAFPKKNMNRITELARKKPVIFIYNYLYRYYLEDMGEDLYLTIQEKYQEKLVFSNLKSNVKIYLFDNTSDPSYYHNLYTEGISYFKNELRKAPDNLDLINYLGWTYYCKGDLDQAIETWKKKLELAPEDADAYNNLGLAYAGKAKYKEAVIQYKDALRFKPLDDRRRARWAKAMIYFNLAWALEKIGDKKDAMENWQNFYDAIPYPENQKLMKRHIGIPAN